VTDPEGCVVTLSNNKLFAVHRTSKGKLFRETHLVTLTKVRSCW